MEGSAVVYIDRWQRALKAFASNSIRYMSFELISRFCYKAMDVQTPLSPLNIPGMALRGMHWLSLRVFFKDPVAVMGEVAKVVSLAPKTAISRALIFENAFETLLYRCGYCLYQPVLTSITSIARDTANPNGIGSTTTVTSAAIKAYHMNTTDYLVSVLSYSFTEFINSAIAYSLIPRLSGKPSAMAWELRLVSLAIKVIGHTLAAAALTKVVGPSASAVTLFGKHFPLSTIGAATGFVVTVALKFLETPISRRWVKLRMWLSGLSATNIQAQVVSVAKRDFAYLVGKEWRDMSEPDLSGLSKFLFQCSKEGLLAECAIQFGVAYLMCIIDILEVVEPCRNTLLLKALDNGDLIRPNNEDAHDPVQTLRADSSVFGPEPSMVVDEDPCAVCLKQLKREIDDIVIGAQCRHAYHTNCLRECLNLNAKCPLCNTVLLKVAEEERYVVPMAENEHGPAQFLKFGFNYNESAKGLFSRMFSRFKYMAPWSCNLELLSAHIKTYDCSPNPIQRQIHLYVLACDDHYRSLVWSYGTMVKPYTQIFGPPRDDSSLLRTALGGCAWFVIVFATSTIKVYSFWGTCEANYSPF